MSVVDAFLVFDVIFVAVEASNLGPVFVMWAICVGMVHTRTVRARFHRGFALPLGVSELEALVALKKRREVTDVDTKVVDIHSLQVQECLPNRWGDFEDGVVEHCRTVLLFEAELHLVVSGDRCVDRWVLSADLLQEIVPFD